MARGSRGEAPAALFGVGGAESKIFRERARRLGLSFVPHFQLGSDAITDINAVTCGKAALSAGGDLYIAPDEETMPEVIHRLNSIPSARPRVFVTTPTAIRAALREAGADRFLHEAVGRLEAVDPTNSARRRVTLSQGITGVVLIVAAIAAFALSPLAALTFLELAAAIFFAGVAAIRFTAAGLAPERLPIPEMPRPGEVLPIYTVLVPLRDEAHMLLQLRAGLDRLRWPRDRLDIKLVIDADDVATLRAARALLREAPYEIVVVPPGGPRTKPMALQYALTFARGEFVTVYDAEDRPHPYQLAEAYATFRCGPLHLACLQAPLVIDNAGKSRLASLFAVEYAALFDGLLPALVKLKLPTPLGGTSNHFRRSALEHVGGWDPWNVTEDADLGVRLVRFGYETATITLPTLEEAPETLGPWMRQRTRWLKGWLQTWLVHMRHPRRLWKSLGRRRFLGFNALGLGMIISAVAHPLFLATPFLLLANPQRLWSEGDLVIAALAGLSIFNLAAGYAAMWALAAKSLALRGRHSLLRTIKLLPLYWLLMGVACVKALAQLASRPHHWDKTPHVGRPLLTRAVTGAVREAPSRLTSAEPSRVRRRA
ncbi:MAG TPA: glycosyltransferase family 2 protein [Bauldia sp.]|nr:glycosyltransferase family 2 protein [Bauldia sp.]